MNVVNEPHRPMPPPRSELPPTSSSRAAVLALAGFASLAVWAWVVLACFRQSSDVDKLGDRFGGPSAIQISQVADQSMLRCLAYLSAGAASTAAFLVVAVWVYGSQRQTA